MATVSSTSGSPATQFGWEQLKLQQAKRNADQAEQAAQALQQQAQDARRTADREDQRAQSLSVQSDQAQGNASRARQGVAGIQSAGQMQTQVGKVADQVVQKQQAAPPAAPVATPAVPLAPVINTQWQATGKIINITA